MRRFGVEIEDRRFGRIADDFNHLIRGQGIADRIAQGFYDRRIGSLGGCDLESRIYENTVTLLGNGFDIRCIGVALGIADRDHFHIA